MRSMKSILQIASALTAFGLATPALADDASESSAITITGTAAVTSEYRLRGVSQSDGYVAVQGGLTVTHESGFYVGTWGSNLAGFGTWGGANVELDAIAGFSKSVGKATLDGGVVYYIYPGATGHNYVELYGSVSGKVGPVNAKLGTYWVPDQQNAFGHNIWVYTDMGLPIANTPITLKGHVGYSSGNSVYTRGANIVDYGIGADLSWKKLTFNVSYVGTNLDSTFANANFGGGNRTGRQITKGSVVATLSASF